MSPTDTGPATTPVTRLRRVLDIYESSPDDRMVLDATNGIYNEPDGLTLGDLRAIAEMVGA
jgi:hypothetical protein